MAMWLISNIMWSHICSSCKDCARIMMMIVHLMLKWRVYLTSNVDAGNVQKLFHSFQGEHFHGHNHTITTIYAYSTYDIDVPGISVQVLRDYQKRTPRWCQVWHRGRMEQALLPWWGWDWGWRIIDTTIVVSMMTIILRAPVRVYWPSGTFPPCRKWIWLDFCHGMFPPS